MAGAPPLGYYAASLDEGLVGEDLPPLAAAADASLAAEAAPDPSLAAGVPPEPGAAAATEAAAAATQP